MVFLEKHLKGVLIQLHIQPGASKSEIKGSHGDALKIRIQAPPVDGKANAELIRFLAEVFKTSKSKIHILKGESGRQKTVLIEDLLLEDVISYLE